MLTPIELQGKVFKTGFGYDKKDVEAFLKEVVDGYERLYKENLELNDKINVLSEGVQYYKSMEKTLQKALVLAEKTAQDTENMAKEKAEAIVSEAQKKASLIKQEALANAEKITNNSLHVSQSLQLDARKSLDHLRLQITMLVQQFENYKIKYRQLLAAQTELLENDSFSIDFALLKEQLTERSSKEEPQLSDTSSQTSTPDYSEPDDNYEESNQNQHHQYVIRDIAPEESEVYEEDDESEATQENSDTEQESTEYEEKESHPVMDDDFLPTIDLSGILDEVKKDTAAKSKERVAQTESVASIVNKPVEETAEEKEMPSYDRHNDVNETSDYDYNDDEQEELSEQDLLQQLFSVNPKKKTNKKASSGKTNDFEFFDL